MARLNEAQSSTAEALETQKRKWLRQNKELAKVNSQQASRIGSLEAETTSLLTENISLRERVIRLEAAFDRHERGARIVDAVDGTRRRLQEKLAEFAAIVGELEVTPESSKEVTPAEEQQQQDLHRSAESTPVLESRLMRPSYNPGEIMDGLLPAIQEDVLSRRSSLNSLASDRRRSSFGFEEIRLPPPEPEPQHEETEENLQKTPPHSLVDTRPRRRRDSALPHAVERQKPVFVPNPIAALTNKAPKRKFSEKDPVPVIDKEPKIPSSNEQPEERWTSEERRRRRSSAGGVVVDVVEVPVTPVDDGDVVMQDPAPSPPTQVEAEAASEPEKWKPKIAEPETQKSKAAENTIKEKKSASELRKSSASSLPAPTTTSTNGSARKALGPKSANLDPMNSPLKKAVSAAAAGQDPSKPLSLDKPPAFTFEKPALETPERPDCPPPSTRVYRASKIRDKDTPPPETDPAATTTSSARPSRSARNRSNVSYAEPSLRAKMRREETKLVDAVTGEGRTRRGKGSLRGGDLAVEGEQQEEEGENNAEVRVKEEPKEDAEEQFRWLRIAAAPPGQPVKEEEGNKEKDAPPPQPQLPAYVRRSSSEATGSGIAALLEKSQARRDRLSSGTSGIPSHEFLSHRRRSSASAFGDGAAPGADKPAEGEKAQRQQQQQRGKEVAVRTKSELFELPVRESTDAAAASEAAAAAAAKTGQEAAAATGAEEGGSGRVHTRRVTLGGATSTEKTEEREERVRAGVPRVSRSAAGLAEDAARRQAMRRRSMVV